MDDIVVAGEIAAQLEHELGGVEVDAAHLWIGPNPLALDKDMAINSTIFWASDEEWQKREHLSSTWCLDLPMLLLILPWTCSNCYPPQSASTSAA